ncbi:MAG: tRNA threonylcarbamoyladenosine dehydratase [Lachnospiraceae bacterium]
MQEQFSRTELLLGSKAMEKLAASRIAVFGIGGVGGHAADALARSGIGEFDLIDNDMVSQSNINRQIIATLKTIGRYKVDVMKEHILNINPRAKVHTYKTFFLPGGEECFPFNKYSYIIDAVDTITAKIGIILEAQKACRPVISSMGAGNKLEASQFKVSDIYSTKVCPLAKVMRRELKKRGIKKLKVVYSEEAPVVPYGITDKENAEKKNNSRPVPGSVAFVPSVAGLIIAGEVVKDLVQF